MPNGHTAWSCVFSPDGQNLLTTGLDSNAQLWSVPGGQPVATPLPHQSYAALAAYSPTGRLFATAQQDGLVRVWRPALPNPHDYRLTVDGNAGGVALSHDGQHMIVTGTAEGRYSSLRNTRVYDVATGKPAGPHLAVNGLVLNAALSPDGQHAVTLSPRDAPPGKAEDGQLPTATPPSKGRPPGMETFAGPLAGKAGWLQCWNWHTGKKLFDPVPMPSLPYGVVYSPDGKRVVATCRGGEVLIIDSAQARVLVRLHHRSLTSPDTGWLDTGWRTDFRWAVFSPDGDTFVTGGADVVRVWETTTGKLRYSPLKHQGVCQCAAFSFDGRFIVTSDDKKAQVWDIATGQPAAEPLRHPNQVSSACFSPDGRQVCTSCQDKASRLWDWRAGRLVCPPLKSSTEYGSNSCFTPDGRWVLTAKVNECRVWESLTGKPITPPLLRDIWGSRVAVTPNGSYALSAGLSPTIGVIHLGDLYEPGVLSSDDVCLVAELLSDHRIHESDVAGLTTEEWLDRWRLFRERHPHYFQLEPGDRLAWHRRQGEEAEAAGQWSAVTWHRDRLILAEPADGRHYAHRARAYQDLNQCDKAAADYSKAMELNPSELSLWSERGNAYLALSQWDKAAADLEQVVERSPDNANLGYWYALTRLGAGDGAGYRSACAALLEHFGTSAAPDVAHWVAWPAVLAPEAGPGVRRGVPRLWHGHGGAGTAGSSATNPNKTQDHPGRVDRGPGRLGLYGVRSHTHTTADAVADDCPRR